MSDTDKPWAAALGRIASGLFVLTARRGPLETGMLASWVQQCSFEPPLVMAAVHRGGVLEAWLHPGDPFVLNVLAEGDKELLRFFAKRVPPAEDAFATLAVERLSCGTAVLARALAYMDCRVESVHVTTGDHELLVGRVLGGRVLQVDGKPAVHVRKNGLHY